MFRAMWSPEYGDILCNMDGYGRMFRSVYDLKSETNIRPKKRDNIFLISVINTDDLNLHR
jgi:hypothetical protein